MKSNTDSVLEYIDQLDDNRKDAFLKVRDAILTHLPDGYSEEMSYGMIGYVVPHARYPDGYHCDPAKPLPFISLALQKNFIALYHMGLYADVDLLNWFTAAYNNIIGKPDMGKSCIRFKNPAKIPFELIGELAGKLTVSDWITLYEKSLKQ